MTGPFPLLADVIRDHLLLACEQAGWKIPVVAAMLGVTTKTVYNHLNCYESHGYVRWLPSRGWSRVPQPQPTTVAEFRTVICQSCAEPAAAGRSRCEACRSKRRGLSRKKITRKKSRGTVELINDFDSIL